MAGSSSVNNVVTCAASAGAAMVATARTSGIEPATLITAAPPRL